MENLSTEQVSDLVDFCFFPSWIDLISKVEVSLDDCYDLSRWLLTSIFYMNLYHETKSVFVALHPRSNVSLFYYWEFVKRLSIMLLFLLHHQGAPLLILRSLLLNGCSLGLYRMCRFICPLGCCLSRLCFLWGLWACAVKHGLASSWLPRHWSEGFCCSANLAKRHLQSCVCGELGTRIERS